MTGLDATLVVVAGVAAGAINALAGGGTLLTYPVLTAMGLSPISANVTNAVALAPGFLGGTLAQRVDLSRTRPAGLLFIAAISGSVVGALLLLATSDEVFLNVVPFLIACAGLLVAFQNRIRDIVDRRLAHASEAAMGALAAMFTAGVYGGYFGAGLGVVLLAVLGLLRKESLNQLNALKQALSFVMTFTTACFFAFSGQVSWEFAVVLSAGTVVGGVVGGRIAHRVNERVLRHIVVILSFAVAAAYASQ